MCTDTCAESRGISIVAPRSYGSGGRGASLEFAGGTLWKVNVNVNQERKKI